ncbi:MAG TPA: hypothetical protein VNJ01_12500 [Bacteriovoracaceae bacterium]|nr:hypothetical protein [Bacteriovoracaceae bacterium]
MKLREKGQSTIEFILTFIFGLSVILVIFNSAMNYATGYLVHYATYMASRRYLTSDSFLGRIDSPDAGLKDGPRDAADTFSQYSLGIFKVPKTAMRINEAGNIPASEYLTVGAFTVFSQPIDAVGKVAGQSKLELVSESFLGKEPTRAECANRVCKAIKGTDDCKNTDDITLFDDGC